MKLFANSRWKYGTTSHCPTGKAEINQIYKSSSTIAKQHCQLGNNFDFRYRRADKCCLRAIKQPKRSLSGILKLKKTCHHLWTQYVSLNYPLLEHYINLYSKNPKRSIHTFMLKYHVHHSMLCDSFFFQRESILKTWLNTLSFLFQEVKRPNVKSLMTWFLQVIKYLFRLLRFL